MLSKEMYGLLKSIPRYQESISYDILNPSNNPNIKYLIVEATYHIYDYINRHGELIENSEFSLTEKGQAAIEQYEQDEENNRIVAQSLKISEKSLKVTTRALWVAIISAIAAFLALIPQLPMLIKFFQSLSNIYW